jgi:IS30 family transposase
MDEEAATEADSGRPDCDRSAAERRLGVRAIARKLGRSPSVISTEIGRGREPDGTYAAALAQAAAAARWGTQGQACAGQPPVC